MAVLFKVELLGGDEEFFAQVDASLIDLKVTVEPNQGRNIN